MLGPAALAETFCTGFLVARSSCGLDCDNGEIVLAVVVDGRGGATVLPGVLGGVVVVVVFAGGVTRTVDFDGGVIGT